LETGKQFGPKARRALPFLVLAVIVVAVAALWLGWAVWGVAWLAEAWRSHDPSLLQSLGQTGDLFGGVNALFAAFAFVGVAIAAYFQFQSYELLRRQHARESFEPLFFRLLEATGEHAPKPKALRSIMGEHMDMQDALKELHLDIEQRIKQGAVLIAMVRARYGLFYDRNQDVLGPWFRSLYHVFKLIDRSGLSRDERVEYANIARATLSKSALGFLALNCVTDMGREFRELVNAYGLLKHLPRDTKRVRASDAVREVEINDDLVERLYEPTAVMSSDEREVHWVATPGKRPPSMK
jgi:hypothetical protein